MPVVLSEPQHEQLACFMADLPLPTGHTPPQWLDGEQDTRARWRQIVIARRHLHGI